MQRQTIDQNRKIVDVSSATWYGFPKEVENRLAIILQNCGYESSPEQMPDAESFLVNLEYSVKANDLPFPWAVIFFPKEYPLAGHLLSIRPNRDIRFFCYSLMDIRKFESYDPKIDGAPPMSIVYVYSKSAIMSPRVSESPIMKEASEALADKPDNGNWAIVVDPIDPAWVEEAAKTNEALYAAFSNSTGSA
ncbi:MAG: hypothetical protein OJF60_003464 [Burkholderiaceae bacterium]|jgi:hypothetical protein|nr:MAG: hypothetical protein OJF60_003464 [Burkholderiaceae bacterium]